MLQLGFWVFDGGVTSPGAAGSFHPLTHYEGGQRAPNRHLRSFVLELIFSPSAVSCMHALSNYSKPSVGSNNFACH